MTTPGLAGFGIGEINIVVDLPAAGFGRDYSASLIARTSTCHSSLLSALEYGSVPGFAQITPPRTCYPGREKRCHALIRAVLSRISREEECKTILILHPYCTLEKSKPLNQNRLPADYGPTRKRTYLNGYRGFEWSAPQK